jgi:hypothetical protein
MNDGYHFIWKAPRAGCRVVSANPAHEEREPYSKAPVTNEARYLVFADPQGEALLYRPRETDPGLFMAFKNTPTTEAEIRAFAERYGFLGGPDTHRVKGPAEAEIRTFTERSGVPVPGDFFGERISSWRKRINRMHQVCEVESAVRHLDLPYLKDHIDMRGDVVAYRDDKKKPWPGRLAFSLICSDRYRPELRELIRVGDYVMAARCFLQEQINEHLKDAASPRLLWDNDGELRMFHVPSSLLACMWLQLAESIDHGLRWRTCRQCGAFFSGGRKDKQFCSTRCRVAANREKRS